MFALILTKERQIHRLKTKKKKTATTTKTTTQNPKKHPEGWDPVTRLQRSLRPSRLARSPASASVRPFGRSLSSSLRVSASRVCRRCSVSQWQTLGDAGRCPPAPPPRHAPTFSPPIFPDEHFLVGVVYSLPTTQSGPVIGAQTSSLLFLELMLLYVFVCECFPAPAAQPSHIFQRALRTLFDPGSGVPSLLPRGHPF